MNRMLHWKFFIKRILEYNRNKIIYYTEFLISEIKKLFKVYYLITSNALSRKSQIQT